MAVRKALTEKLLEGQAAESVVLDSSDTDKSLTTAALLCGVRKNYVGANLSVNFLSGLVSKLTEESKPAPKPGDLASALKLLLATTTYSISDKAKSQPQDDTVEKACQTDLKTFDVPYYGEVVKFEPGESVTEHQDEALQPLAFLGPVGTLVSAITSILEPIFIDASTIVDEEKRRAIIVEALSENASKIESYSGQIAKSLDSYSATQRRSLAGQFNEAASELRTQVIDLSKEGECRQMSTAKRLVDGEPSTAFVSCWNHAWGQIQPHVADMAKLGDSYDTLADAGNQSADTQLSTILKSYRQISTGHYAPTNVFWDDITQFVGLVNAIGSAASTTNVNLLRKDIKAVAK
jgi:hypothetical protein